MYELNQYVPIYCNTCNPDTGTAINADSDPVYEIYENVETSPIVTGILSQHNSQIGFYLGQRQLLATDGFENGKNYIVRIIATVNSVTGSQVFAFSISDTLSNIEIDTSEIQSKLPSNSIAGPGDQMDLVNSLNAAAVSIIKSGLSTFDPASDQVIASNMRGTDGAYTGIPPTAEQISQDMIKNRIQKNVALGNFPIFLVQNTDHESPALGQSVTARIVQDNNTIAGCTNDVIEIGNGLYRINLTQEEMNADIITLLFSAIDADQRIITLITSE